LSVRKAKAGAGGADEKPIRRPRAEGAAAADIRGAPGAARPRSRLDPQVRRNQILDAAVQFFAKHGFEAQTKDLAAQLGVSQGLIFRYFGTKQNLVEEVYERVFLQRWSRAWERGLVDRTRPLAARIEEFYLSYFEAVDDAQWIRVSLYAGLSGRDIIARYIRSHVHRVLEIIARELRVHRGLPEKGPLASLELELVWHLHSTFIYFLVRKYIHHQPVMADKQALVACVVDNFLKAFETRTPADRRNRGAAPHFLHRLEGKYT